MVTRNLHRHISGQFEEQLEEVRLKFANMGGLVEKQLFDAMRSFTTCDLQLAQRVRSIEDRVNQLELEIDNATTTIIALRQPAASDLRMLIALLKNATDLERIGDETNRIAKTAVKSPSYDPISPIHVKLTSMQEAVTRNLRDALDTFARMDDEAAVANIARDREVDDTYDRIVDESSEAMSVDPDHVERHLAVIWVARALERVGDHAKNINENVIYAVRGVDVRHPNN